MASLTELPSDLLAECVLSAVSSRDRASFFSSSQANREVLRESVLARRLAAGDRLRRVFVAHAQRRRARAARLMDGWEVSVRAPRLCPAPLHGIAVAPTDDRVCEGFGVVSPHIYARGRPTSWYDRLDGAAEVDYLVSNWAQFVPWREAHEIALVEDEMMLM